MNAPLYSPAGVCLAIPRDEFNRLCSLFASELQLAGCIGPEGARLDPMQLLIALGGRESDFGANLKPRHEPSWDAGGHVWMHSRELQGYIKLNGAAGASSYGPLQVMAFDAGGSYAVKDLAHDPQVAMEAAVKYFNRYVTGHWRARTLEEICRTWNGGHPSAGTTPGYVEAVTHYYATETVAECWKVEAPTPCT